jgi:hypothetical protein
VVRADAIKRGPAAITSQSREESERGQLRVAVAEGGDSSGTQRKGKVRRWKLLLSNG